MQPRIVREAAARDRAIAQRVRLQVIEPRRRYLAPSQSQDDTVYTVTVAGRVITCDCPGHTFTGLCKHSAALQMRAEREGWLSAKAPRDLAVTLLRGKGR